MKRIIFPLLIVFAAFGALPFSLTPCRAEKAAAIMVYSGAGMRKPMDAIGVAFQKQCGTAVHYNYAGSNALLSQMQLTHQGDAYMPGATMYIDIACKKGLISYKIPIAYHIPVITVPRGNPAGVEGLADLVRPDVKVISGDPQVAAIGKIGNKILTKNGLKKAFWSKDVDTTATMNELIIYIAMGQADAAINWWDTVKAVDKIEVIQIPREQNLIKVIPIGVTTFSRHPDTARKFVDFCASEKGKAIFRAHGFVPYPNPAYE